MATLPAGRGGLQPEDEQLGGLGCAAAAVDTSRYFNAAPVGAWGGGRLVLVSARTGITVTWSPGTGHWHQVGTLPSTGAVSLSWTGRTFLAITITATGGNKGTARAFAVTGDRWTPLPDLPQPGKGRIAEAVTAADNGTVYALANISATGRDGFPAAGSVKLLRLTASAWAPVPLAPGVPKSELTLTRVDRGMLAAGSPCPSKNACLEDSRVITLLKPGAPLNVIPLPTNPGPSSCPGPLAAGGRAIVATCPEGPAMPTIAKYLPAPGGSQIYDTAARRWLKGPTAPYSQADVVRYWGAYWTPDGFMSLGRFASAASAASYYGGWLLRPAR